MVTFLVLDKLIFKRHFSIQAVLFSKTLSLSLSLSLLRLLDLSKLQINIRLHKYLTLWQFTPCCAGREGRDRRMDGAI